MEYYFQPDEAAQVRNRTLDTARLARSPMAQRLQEALKRLHDRGQDFHPAILVREAHSARDLVPGMTEQEGQRHLRLALPMLTARVTPLMWSVDDCEYFLLHEYAHGLYPHRAQVQHARAQLDQSLYILMLPYLGSSHKEEIQAALINAALDPDPQPLQYLLEQMGNAPQTAFDMAEHFRQKVTNYREWTEAVEWFCDDYASQHASNPLAGVTVHARTNAWYYELAKVNNLPLDTNPMRMHPERGQRQSRAWHAAESHSVNHPDLLEAMTQELLGILLANQKGY